MREDGTREGVFAVGAVDVCAGEMTSILLNEIFGEVAEKKEVAKIQAKMKETGPSKALHSMEMLASMLSFPHVMIYSGVYD